MSLLLIAIVSVGCAESHGTGPDTDSGPRRACSDDAGSTVPLCVYGSGHVCGDALTAAECVDGALRCPSGSVLESEAECWCYGAPLPGCTCVPGGWSCADSGIWLDAGASGCPSDPSSAEGTPCSPEGTTCGRCTDSCGWCNILACEGGVWTHLEAFPPPDPCTSFECGPELRCQAETQYCEHVLSDVGGWPDDYQCRPLPEGCHGCDCRPDPAGCTEGSEGGITVTYGGG